MSIKELQPGELRRSEKGAATGFIKGSLTNLHTTKKFDFKASSIWRDEQQGTLRFHCVMGDPENSEKEVGVAVQLRQTDTPTGTYLVGSPEVIYLSYLRYGADGHVEVDYPANSGRVDLKNAYPEKPISGKLFFDTRDIGGSSYRVDVEYSITEF